MIAPYAAAQPNTAGLLQVGDGHTAYGETVGDRAGLPAVYVHGGPGSGAAPEARRYFDPDAYHAVLFDQRGCGRSRPRATGPDADLSTNTTRRRERAANSLVQAVGLA